MSELQNKNCPFCGLSVQYKPCACRPELQRTFENMTHEEWQTRPIEDALQAENARLREALENVSNALGGSDMRDIARTALKGTPHE